MQQKYRLFRRGWGTSQSKVKAEAVRIVAAKNEATTTAPGSELRLGEPTV
jgi:hypothetical protein